MRQDVRHYIKGVRVRTRSGVGAYDHVLKSTMLERLMHMPTAQAMLPFVRMSHGTYFF